MRKGKCGSRAFIHGISVQVVTKSLLCGFGLSSVPSYSSAGFDLTAVLRSLSARACRAMAAAITQVVKAI